MIDFPLDDNLDIKLDDNMPIQENKITTLLTAFYTDSRIDKKKGYWLPIISSEFWLYDKARLLGAVIRNLNETAKETCKKLVDDGLYKRIDSNVTKEDGAVKLHVICYDTEGIILNRKFII